jgi:hypothetical protein
MTAGMIRVMGSERSEIENRMPLLFIMVSLEVPPEYS